MDSFVKIKDEIKYNIYFPGPLQIYKSAEEARLATKGHLNPGQVYSFEIVGAEICEKGEKIMT